MKQISFGKYDTQILIQARRNLENVFSVNYQPSSRKSALLDTIISKLDRLLKEYGASDEVDAYFGKHEKICGAKKDDEETE